MLVSIRLESEWYVERHQRWNRLRRQSRCSPFSECPSVQSCFYLGFYHSPSSPLFASSTVEFPRLFRLLLSPGGSNQGKQCLFLFLVAQRQTCFLCAVTHLSFFARKIKPGDRGNSTGKARLMREPIKKQMVSFLDSYYTVQSVIT